MIFRFMPSHAAIAGAAMTAVATGMPHFAQAQDAAGGFYTSLRIGPSILQDMNFADRSTADLSLDPATGFGVSGALGYRFADSLRIEAELGYGRNDLAGTFQQNVQAFVPCGEIAGNPCLDPKVDGKIGAVSGFAMAYYDFPEVGRLRPYAGLGLGFVNVNLDVGARASMNDGVRSRFDIIDGSDTVMAYRGMVGLAYELGAAAVTVGYGYTFTDRMNVPGRGPLVSFDFDRRFKAHALNVGVTYRF